MGRAVEVDARLADVLRPVRGHEVPQELVFGHSFQRDDPPERVVRVHDVELEHRELGVHLRDGADAVREDPASVARGAADVVRPEDLMRCLLAVGHELGIDHADHDLAHTDRPAVRDLADVRDLLDRGADLDGRHGFVEPGREFRVEVALGEPLKGRNDRRGAGIDELFGERPEVLVSKARDPGTAQAPESAHRILEPDGQARAERGHPGDA